MTWVRLDDGFAQHPKMEAAGPLGLALQVAALCYCAQQLTDGIVPRSVARRLLALDDPDGVISALVRVGSWHEHEHECVRCDDVPDGAFIVHDYAELQPTKAATLELRAQRSAAGSKGGKRSGETRREATASAFASPGLEAKPNPVPSRPGTTSSSVIDDAVRVLVDRKEAAHRRDGQVIRSRKSWRDAVARNEYDEHADAAGKWVREHPHGSADELVVFLAGKELTEPDNERERQEALQRQHDRREQIEREEREAVGSLIEASS